MLSRNNIKDVNSLIVAILLSYGCITSFLNYVFGVSTNGNLYVLIIVFALYVFTYILGNRMTVYKRELLLLVVLALIYLHAWIVGTSYTLIQFLFYAIIPVIFINKEIDAKRVLEMMMYISILTIFSLDNYFQIQYESINQATLGDVYSILPVAIAGIIHFALYRHESNWMIKILYVYCAYFIIRILIVANRGAVLSFVFCVGLLLLNQYSGNNKKRNRNNYIKLLIAFLIIMIVFYNAVPILETVNNIASSHGIQLSFVKKTIYYLNIGNLGNSRDVIYTTTWGLIKDHNFLGYGIETFPQYVNGAWDYPHNIILQYIFEMGFFAIIPLFFALLPILKVLLGKISEKEKFTIFILLICIAFPRLFFSTDPWKCTEIWMLIAISFKEWRLPKIRSDSIKLGNNQMLIKPNSK